jgi:tRNA A-37 threonylcarbamoyl transferase component Bud32
MADERALTDWVEALVDEQRQSWEKGERAPVEGYLGCRPDLEAGPTVVLELIFNEVLLREERGEEPRPEEYVSRFPHLTTQIQTLFEVHRGIDFPALPGPLPAGGPGPSVPGYEVLEELGRGGMGVVYKARHVKLNRTVALKMLLAGRHAGPEQMARLQSEGEAVARLQHPNIVQVFEVGAHQGTPFLALEFCPGGPLDRKLGGAPLRPREAAALVEALAGAMHAAHLQGVVHRDLKPANVLLAEDGTPKISDFGLAKKLDEPGLTVSGAVMGTPLYMAPEQAAGRNREVGPRSDVYALGAILYELLTGRPPFRAATPVETLAQVLREEPVPVRRLAPQVPRDLETVCHRCLEKNPARRYASAAALGEDLRRCRADQPTLARPLGPAERAWRAARRNPALTLVALAGLTMLLFVAACLAWSSYRSARLMAEVNQVQRPLQELSGRIRYLDEVLTSSASLAVATNDPAWEKRYYEHEPQLDAAFREAVRLAPEAGPSLAEVEAANGELVALEKEAFERARRGAAADAWQLLQGPRYRGPKQRYASALATFTAHLDSRQQALLARARAETEAFVALAVSMAAVVLLLFVAGGCIVTHSLRRK